MGKNNRSEVTKRLTQEIAKTTDPETLIRLSNALAKVKPKKRRVHKPAVEKPKKTHSPILDTIYGSAVDNLSDGGKVLHHIVVELEKKRREFGRDLTLAETDTLKVELLNTLSAKELEVLEAYEPPEFGFR